MKLKIQIFVTNYHKLFMNSDYAHNIREIGEISGGVLNEL